jgi:CheY-like chemotaxis protein
MKAGTRILVVEDDRSIARLVQLELEHRNFEVRCAYDGPSGLEAVSDFEPAVIVLDIMLPGLDGVGVLKKLRAAGNRVPVIMLTARGDPLDKVHSLDRGADDYLSEVVAKMAESGMPEDTIREALEGLALEIHDFGQDLAFQARWLRPLTRSRGLSLGDRACLALGQRLDLPVLTTDKAWEDLQLDV